MKLYINNTSAIKETNLLLNVISIILQFIIKLRFPATKSIAQVVKRRYGRPTLILIRKFEALDFKQRKVALDIDFLHNCQKHDLAPKFVQFKVANKALRGSRTYKECQRKLIIQELSEKNRLQKAYTKKMSQLKIKLRAKLKFIDFIHISSKFLNRNNHGLNRIRLIQEKKLFNLGMRTAAETNDPEKVIFNFSSHTLTASEKSLLAKGLNLSIPPKELNYGTFLQPFESFYSKILQSKTHPLSTSSTDTISAAIKSSALGCFNSYDAKLEQNLTKEEYDGLRSLVKDDNIIIQKSDKGNSVVIINKVDYVSRMNELLADTSKFKKLNIQPGHDYNFLINQELRISKELRSMKDSGTMVDSLYHQLNPTGTQPSVLYGLAKIHKPAINNIPKMRPILSAINSPTYKLSQYMNKLLKPFTTNQFTCRNSFSFADNIIK